MLQKHSLGLKSCFDLISVDFGSCLKPTQYMHNGHAVPGTRKHLFTILLMQDFSHKKTVKIPRMNRQKGQRQTQTRSVELLLVSSTKCKSKRCYTPKVLQLLNTSQ